MVTSSEMVLDLRKDELEGLNSCIVAVFVVDTDDKEDSVGVLNFPLT